ncbi:MAG: LytTR family DNA-binding domain-containing protein [Chitinophagaceae bacterium]
MNDSSIQCLVIDDEPLAISLISDYVTKTPGLALAASTTSALEALKILEKQAIDAVFLDIQMPELTGIQFLQVIDKKYPVVLTTAYAEFALKGYEHNVVDYLLKPVSFQRFLQSAEKLKDRLLSKTVNDPEPGKSLFIKTEYKVRRVNLDDILFIEALKDYIAVHTASEKILSLQSMRELEELLPRSLFLRVHRSYIIAIHKIESIERNRVVINKQHLPIGDSYKEAVKKVIGH